MNDQTQKIQALHIAYLSLVRALHEHGALPVSAVVTTLGNQLDREAKNSIDSKINPWSKHIYDALLGMESYFNQSKDRQTPDSSD
ncbi:hypothetical protein [Burkholderia pseudomallei]|uniref:hypothetical protein n=1 Tax=Burkholderia pseudomallei TaxID=28450 RepID=UPI0005DF3825|nr:hypothetical protein [Burkholderia pseudomallei]OMQ49920.1 hypothetical protein AQ709_05210 [Burkholderia pseudomallei]OMQ74393.1 hypothetical protein AQ711_22965 [Burkholderia pseudomallei]OMQ77327.1 hypothetical protein AQ712_02745 [Burkholderia pseudomallei]CAJ9926075.1 Uncharacterised protein [Burkholderia pseudomallei]CAK1307546.1 Uncharacterised protein [Burkholderia pseudomallei]